MEDLALIIAVFLGGVVVGCSGFAFSAVAGAVLYHFIEPIDAVSIMLCCSVVTQAATLIALRRHIDWRESVPMMMGGVLGTPIGVYVLTIVEGRTLRSGFGAFLALYALYMLINARPARSDTFKQPEIANFAVGSASGFVGGLTAMPGALPVIWCNFRGMAKERQRGVVQPFILGMQLIAIAMLVVHPTLGFGKFTARVAIVLPALAFGTCLGFLLFGRIDAEKFRIVVWALLLFSGCVMMA